MSSFWRGQGGGRQGRGGQGRRGGQRFNHYSSNRHHGSSRSGPRHGYSHQHQNQYRPQSHHLHYGQQQQQDQQRREGSRNDDFGDSRRNPVLSSQEIHNPVMRSASASTSASASNNHNSTSHVTTNNPNVNYMDIPIPVKARKKNEFVVPNTVAPAPVPASAPTPFSPHVVRTNVEHPPPPAVPSAQQNESEDVTMVDADENVEEVKRPKIIRKIKVTRENFGEVSLEEKLVSENPFESVDLELADQLLFPTKWMDKKLEAVQHTKAIMKEIIQRDNDQYYDPYDSERSEESVLVGSDYGLCDRTPPGFYQFLESLPYSIFFDAGFLVMGVHADDEKNCFCPCSHRMHKWRRNMDLCEPTGLDGCGNTFKKGSPNALMDHLKKIGEHEKAYMHKALRVYLEKLYENYWGHIYPGVHHKGIYIAGTNDYKRAEAAEKKFLHRALKNYEATLKRKDEEIARKEAELQEMEALKNANVSLTEKVKLLEENRKALNVTEKPKMVTVHDIDEGSFRAYKDHFTPLMVRKRESVFTEGREYSPVKITIPPTMNIQELFDKWFDEGTKDKTFLFRPLDNLSTKNGAGEFAWKVLIDWDVVVEVPKDVMRRGFKELTAVDQGGPTRAFITAFCEQLRDLCVYVPVKHQNELEEPPNLSRVKTQSGKEGIVIWVRTESREEENKPKEKLATFKIKLEDGYEILGRSQFEVKEIPFPLFDETIINCAVPHRKQTFESFFDNEHYRKAIGTSAEYNLDYVLHKACRYYEAIGRVIIHAIFDDNVVLSSVVLPQLLKNYFIHGIRPDYGEHIYPMPELLVDIQNMEPSFSIDLMDKGQLYFETYYIDDELIKKYAFHDKIKASDAISKTENFRKFVVLHMIASRDMALESIRKGLTLNGRVDLKDIFFPVPPIYLNALYFSNPEFGIDDIMKILIFVPCEHSKKDMHEVSTYEEMHKMFQESTLPSAFRILQHRDPDILKKFLYYVTGISYLPNFEMNFNFRITVEFKKGHERRTHDDLPTSHTCEKIIVFPATVYDNNDETLASKLEKALSYGDSFGFH